VTQDSLYLACTCGITFGNRNALKCPILAMTFQQIWLYIPVTSKAIGSTNNLQKTACVQAGIHITTSQSHTCCLNMQSDGVVHLLGKHQVLECYIDILKQGHCTGLFIFQSDHGISGHNNKPGLTAVK
jgi:hypothetical protein